jgi:hypothetical protein
MIFAVRQFAGMAFYPLHIKIGLLTQPFKDNLPCGIPIDDNTGSLPLFRSDGMPFLCIIFFSRSAGQSFNTFSTYAKVISKKNAEHLAASEGAWELKL